MTETTSNGEGAPSLEPPASSPEHTENRTAGFERPEDYNRHNPTRPKVVLTKTTSSSPEHQNEPTVVKYLPKFISQDIKKYTQGFIKVSMDVANAPKEKYLVGLTGRTSQEKIVGQNQAARQAALEIDRAESLGGTLNAAPVFTWLNFRIAHKFREVAGEDPNVSGRVARQKAWLELRRLEMWRDTIKKLASGEIENPKAADRYVKSQYRKLLMEALTAVAWEKSIRGRKIGFTFRRGRKIDEGAVSANAASRKAARQEITDAENAQRNAEREAESQQRQQTQSVPPPAIPPQPNQTQTAGEPTKPPIPPPPPEQAAETQEQKTIEGLRILADQILMRHFAIDEIIEMQKQGKTAEDIDRRFNEAAGEYLQQITIHRQGIDYVRNPDSGRLFGIDHGDLDGRAAVGLLRMAGVRVRVKFVHAGEHTPGDHNIDTGYKNGYAIGAEGEDTKYDVYNPIPDRLTTFADHHGGDVPRDISGTQLTYEMLTRWGMLDKNMPGLKEAVDFINKRDNGLMPTEIYQESYDNLWGLAEEMEIEQIIDYLSQGKTPNEPMVEEYLLKYRLIERDEQGRFLRNIPTANRKRIERNLRNLENMANRGRILTSPIYGKVAIGGPGPRPGIEWSARGNQANAILNWRVNDEDGVVFSAETNMTEETKAFFRNAGIPVVKSNMAVKATAVVPGPVQTSFRETLVALGIPETEWRKSRDIMSMLEEDDRRIEGLRRGR